MFDLHLSRHQSHYHLGGLRFGGSQLSPTKVSGLQLYFLNPMGSTHAILNIKGEFFGLIVYPLGGLTPLTKRTLSQGHPIALAHCPGLGATMPDRPAKLIRHQYFSAPTT
jgi:hypothetical protein